MMTRTRRTTEGVGHEAHIAAWGAGPFVLVALLASLDPSAAHASDPAGTYSIPSRVELLPDAQHPKELILHGIFMQLLPPSDTSDVSCYCHYGNPRCGRMHFVCAENQDEMCAMQWRELKDAAESPGDLCYGFGTTRKVATASVSAESDPLGTPDLWDLGLGITRGTYIDGQCGPAHALRCQGDGKGGAGGTAPGGAGGVAGAAGHTGQAGAGGRANPAGTPGGGSGAGHGGLGEGGRPGGTGGMSSMGTGGAAPPTLGGSSGCQVADGAPGLLGTALFGAWGVFARARRRRGGACRR